MACQVRREARLVDARQLAHFPILTSPVALRRRKSDLCGDQYYELRLIAPTFMPCLVFRLCRPNLLRIPVLFGPLQSVKSAPNGGSSTANPRG